MTPLPDLVPDFEPSDPGPIAAHGRRVRRRRAGLVAAVTAVAMVAGVAVGPSLLRPASSAAPGEPGPTSSAVPGEPGQTRAPTDRSTTARAPRPATWEVDGVAALRPTATDVRLKVQGLDCTSGVATPATTPRVTYLADRVVIEAFVEALPGSGARCQGYPAVPYTLTLREPLAGRTLIDAACEPGGAAASMADCRSGAIRWWAGSTRVEPPLDAGYDAIRLPEGLTILGHSQRVPEPGFSQAYRTAWQRYASGDPTFDVTPRAYYGAVPKDGTTGEPVAAYVLLAGPTPCPSSTPGASAVGCTTVAAVDATTGAQLFRQILPGR